VLEQIRDCVLRHGFALEEVLPLATANPARILRLERKGRIEPGMDADLLVLRQDSLELVEVIAGGRRLVAGGALAVHERFLDHTERTIHLQGHSGSSG